MSSRDPFEVLKRTIREALEVYNASIKTLVIKNDQIEQLEVETVAPNCARRTVRRYTCTEIEREIIKACAQYANLCKVGDRLSPFGEALGAERVALLAPECDWDDGETSENAAQPEAGIRAVQFEIWRGSHGYLVRRSLAGTSTPATPEFQHRSTLEAARASLPPGLIRLELPEQSSPGLLETYI